MDNKTDIINFGCPVTVTVDVIGGKWKGVILYHLTDGPKRFNELRRLFPKITQRMLTLQLRELESDGVIHREIYKEIPPRVEYSLTAFGETLMPLIVLMRNWGETYEKTVLSNRESNNIMTRNSTAISSCVVEA
ncbi:DNA-binding transcriptional regulator, HxlR family [Paenibacillus catalpae]|uniref:DNA-binding transcriptional regulator, HxlR family n=1 Tax=Paenibacillus catalpae TaxID=1045775 RepID=A0A1I1YV80_9BACL|nr:winged helix-turn-helix transcriptional regulator [Paenibacillus catalpae]SFE23514.1 DNA-binding transcriptional regulator, HxlR family [Paenibacillus catalpae]